MDLSATIEADSTQVNAVDLTGTSRIVTITGISGGPDKKQPVNIELAEFPGRAYRPCKTMRRILVHAWGPDTKAYLGRRMEIYNDESVKWGGKAVGGIRIKALSDISARFEKTLQESQKSYVTYVIEKLPDVSPPTTKQPTDPTAAIVKAFDGLGVTVDQLEAKVGEMRDGWTPAHITTLTTLGKSIKSGTTTVAAEFPAPQPDSPPDDLITADQIQAVTAALEADNYKSEADQLAHLRDVLAVDVEAIDKLTPAQGEQVLRAFEGA